MDSHATEDIHPIRIQEILGGITPNISIVRRIDCVGYHNNNFINVLFQTRNNLVLIEDT